MRCGLMHRNVRGWKGRVCRRSAGLDHHLTQCGGRLEKGEGGEEGRRGGSEGRRGGSEGRREERGEGEERRGGEGGREGRGVEGGGEERKGGEGGKRGGEWRKHNEDRVSTSGLPHNLPQQHITLHMEPTSVCQ